MKEIEITYASKAEHNFAQRLIIKTIERATGKKCRKCVIFYLKEDRFLSYHVNYMKAEVEALLASMK